MGQRDGGILNGVVVFRQGYRHRLLTVPISGGETQARPAHPDIIGRAGYCHVYGRRRLRGQHHSVGAAVPFRDFQRRRVDGDTRVSTALDRQGYVPGGVVAAGGVHQLRGRDLCIRGRMHDYRPG